MVNEQLTKAAKLKRVERKSGATSSGDSDGVLAVLQTARRLLADSPDLLKGQSMEVRSKKTAFDMSDALGRAVDLAHPKDRSRAIHRAHGVILNTIVAKPDWEQRARLIQTHGHMVNRFNDDPSTTKDDALAVLDDAIRAQGRVNVAAGKAAKRSSE